MIRYLLALALSLTPVAAHAEAALVRIGLQPGMTYLALNVMNREALLEKRARTDGIELKVEWVVSAPPSIAIEPVGGE